MKLFTKSQIEQLTKNGRENAEKVAAGGDDIDFYPVVKLFTPDGAATWLLSEIFPNDPDIASLRANKRETTTRLKFTLEGAGERTDGHALTDAAFA